MTTDIDEARDWQGNEVNCATCPHQSLLAEGRCELRRACVVDRYARRIDRFFEWNRLLADQYLTHPHFEVRAIAASYANVFLLPAMLTDEDENVRWCAVRRLPQRYLREMRNDPHREVRIRIASYLKEVDLPQMMDDSDYYVRLVVARRIAPAMLPLMIEDAETEVRRVVARRISSDWLSRMAVDPDGDVRLEIAQRMTPVQLLALIGDSAWRVRYEVASRIEPAGLSSLLEDPDPIVRDFARARLAESGLPSAAISILRSNLPMETQT